MYFLFEVIACGVEGRLWASRQSPTLKHRHLLFSWHHPVGGVLTIHLSERHKSPFGWSQILCLLILVANWYCVFTLGQNWAERYTDGISILLEGRYIEKNPILQMKKLRLRDVEPHFKVAQLVRL